MMRLHSDASWVSSRLDLVPVEWVGELRETHEKRLFSASQIKAGTGAQNEAIRQGNLWLYELTERLRGVRIPVYLSDSELRDFATQQAKRAMDLAQRVAGGVEQFRKRLESFVHGFGINPPEHRRETKAGKMIGVEDGPAVRRMTCPLWWRRKLRVSQCRAVEGFAVEMGRVHKRREVYASNATVNRRAQQKARNADTLASTEAVNLDTGESYNLGELAARSVANPRIRRGELMVRIAGFEYVAKSLEHAALFITQTCPSKYHRMRAGEKGKPEHNPKWNGQSPREGQGYLTKTWARIRAALHRREIRPYGFRIAEPHHDGTPHWHILLFVVADHAAQLLEIFRDYALEEDGEEPGAQENRIEVVPIDWKRGSAAGYVAKYVSKNIDGYQVQQDLEGENLDAVTGSQRVEAWASAWGIRQFQQVGGPPVGVWRELRRMEKGGEYSDTLEAARIAAGDKDEGQKANWGRYVEIMGGPVVKRGDLPLRVAYTRAGERWDYARAEPYEAKPTAYGEQAPAAIFGLLDCSKGRAFAARRFRWEIRRGGVGLARPKAAQPRSPVNNCTEVEDGQEKRGGGTGGGGCVGGMGKGTATRSGNGGGICRAYAGGAAGAG